MHITALTTQPQGSAPTTSCLVENLAFQLMWHLVWFPHHHGAKHNKFVQKLRERKKWAHEKLEALKAKEAERHKCNYDKRGRAVALEVGDTVLVHVTTFKG